MSNRTPRELETRQNSGKRWTPPSLLPTPIDDPDHKYRWVRTSFMNQPDDRNLSSKRTQGWEAVRLEDHPELQTYGKNSGNVEIGGLMLHKTPNELVDQRNAYYKKFTADQAAAVDATLMKENDPRMPMFSERKSTTSRGTRG
jgi:hypothetical protein